MIESDNFAQENGLMKKFNMFEKDKSGNLLIRSISKQLDQYFSGGLHKGTISQVYGQSGCGKSQIAMLFTLGAITKRIPCCYLSTEKEFSWPRFTSIAYNFVNQSEFEESQPFLSYKRSTDYHQGYLFIEQLMEKIKKNGKGGLLIIDSVHTFIMNCLENSGIQSDSFQKSKKQAQIVNRLRWLAKMSGSAVLLINHAADLLDKKRASSGRTIVPTLGASWQLNIDESIYLTRKNKIRQLVVIHSPKMPTGKKLRFRLQNEGFIWISQDGVQYSQ